MKRNTNIALGLCLTLLGTAIEARADCEHVRGTGTSMAIVSPNDPLGRALGNLTGVLNGATTGMITSVNPPNATTFDVFVTKKGDMLTATGAGTLTPIPGAPPGEVTIQVILTVTGGSGKYAGATGTITLDEQGHNVFGGPGAATFDSIYKGTVCGPNVRPGE